MTGTINTPVEQVVSGLGWPEGPTVLPDGRIVLVESYRSQLTAIGLDGKPGALCLCGGRSQFVRSRV